MTKEKQVSLARKVIGSILVGIFASFHFALIFQNSTASWVGFFAITGLFIYLAEKKKEKVEVKHLQYKTISILSFLLPVSAMLYSFIFTGKAVETAGSEAAEAGAAIGGFIGGGILIFFAFIIGLSLGITFYILSAKKEK